MTISVLETERLLIRGFEARDLDAVYQLLDRDLISANTGSQAGVSRQERQRWLEWNILNYSELANLNQPPYGDRAIVLKLTGQVIGACGLVPCLAPFGQIPGFQSATGPGKPALFTPEVGLFYAVSPALHRKGYASEAARALIGHAFTQLHVSRVVATTTYDNLASIGVMQRLGMLINRNPFSEPPWFQVVSVLENPAGVG